MNKIETEISNRKRHDLEFVSLSIDEKLFLEKKYIGKIHSEYDSLFLECQDAKLIKLSDGRFLLRMMDWLLFENEKYLLSFINSFNSISNRKILRTSYPKIKIGYLLSGKRVVMVNVSKKEAKLLSIISPTMTSENYPGAIYSIDNKQILIINHEEGDGFIYSSINEFEEILENSQKLLEIRHKYHSKEIELEEYECHLMVGKNPFKDEFLKYVSDLSDSLPLLLNAPKSIFDFSPESLVLIERYLYWNEISNNFSDKVFLPLLSYIGETFIRNNSGRWDISHNELYDIWIPNIATKKEYKHIWKRLIRVLDPRDSNRRTLMSVYTYSQII